MSEAGASGEEGKAAVMGGTGELVCEQASITSNIATSYAQMIVVPPIYFSSLKVR